MELSLPAWLGALCGMIVAVAIYVPSIRIVERRLRAANVPETNAQRSAFEDRLSVMRRVILGFAVAVLGTAGYWVGNMLGGNRYSQPVYRGPGNAAVMPSGGRLLNVGRFDGGGARSAFRPATQVGDVTRGGFGSTARNYNSVGG